ncbi:MAG: exodeoxyribonuclease V subunit gamma, partial [Candidatus Dormibacteraeota bacterium]|nr:exodeoxyribonuclease V subunit gamma [Candidatus Dormibacteraeota bacterium]
MLPDVPAAATAPLAALTRRLAESGAEASPMPVPSPTSALDRVRDRLFTPPAAPAIPADGTVRLVSAPDPSREVRAAARACLGWAEEGVPFWEMAVAYRDGDTYRPLVEAIFLEAGIPVYLHEGSPLAQRPVGRQTLALLDLYESDLSRQSVMDFLTDARLPRALRDEFGGVPATAWDSYSRRAGVVGGADQWRDRLGGLRQELRDLDEEGERPDWRERQIEEVGSLSRFVLDLDSRLRAHSERASWAEHLTHLAAVIDRYVMEGDQVVAALRGLERFSALEHEVDFTWFLDVVRRAIETLRSEDVLEGRPGAFARRGVNVVAVNSLPGIEMRRVWMLGATERVFPPPPRQDPILLDTEREAISARSDTVLQPRSARGEEEPLQFALACEAARERLVVSYARRATGAARPQLPSIFFREIASHLEGRRVSAEEAPLLRRDDVERIPGDAIGAPVPSGERSADEAAVRRAAEVAISGPDRDRTLLQAEVTRAVAIATFDRPGTAFARALAAELVRNSEVYSEWDGALSERARAAIARLVPPERPFSPTALETYARCPQQFLMSNVLRVTDVEEPERVVRLDNLRRGTLVHRILERFHGEWQGPGA